MSSQLGAGAVCGRAGLPLTSAVPQMVLHRDPNPNPSTAPQMVDKAAADLNEQHNAVNFSGSAGAAAAFGLKVRAGRPACFQSALHAFRACSRARQVGKYTCSCRGSPAWHLLGLYPACLCTLVDTAPLLLPGVSCGLPSHALESLLRCAARKAASAVEGGARRAAALSSGSPYPTLCRAPGQGGRGGGRLWR
jgi:hypothetical protein